MVTTDPELDTAPRMTFGDHLEELRQRLFYACIGIVLACAFCGWVSPDECG